MTPTTLKELALYPSQDTEDYISESEDKESEVSDNGGADANGTREQYPELRDGGTEEVIGGFPFNKTG